MGNLLEQAWYKTSELIRGPQSMILVIVIVAITSLVLILGKNHTVQSGPTVNVINNADVSFSGLLYRWLAIPLRFLLVAGIIILLVLLLQVLFGTTNGKVSAGTTAGTNSRGTPTATLTQTAQTGNTPTITVAPGIIPANAYPVIYTVKAGDTMWDIAQVYETSAEAIMAANPSRTDANLIHRGNQLVIPVKLPWFRGNSLVMKTALAWDELSKNTDASLEEVLKLNNLSSLAQLQIGDPVLLPSKKS